MLTVHDAMLFSMLLGDGGELGERWILMEVVGVWSGRLLWGLLGQIQREASHRL